MQGRYRGDAGEAFMGESRALDGLLRSTEPTTPGTPPVQQATLLRSSGVEGVTECRESEVCKLDSQRETEDSSEWLEGDVGVYVEAVREIYTLYRKTKLPDIPDMFKRHRGSERELYLSICDKYSVDPMVMPEDHPGNNPAIRTRSSLATALDTPGQG